MQADNRAVPLRTAWADVAVAGWTIGHLRSWFAGSWRVEVGRVLAEMRRVARPTGRLVVCETLGTGSLSAAPPVPELGECYALFESLGFERTVIATDYGFASAEEAAATLGFFFGPDLVDAIRANGWARVPEWTGIWTRDR